MTFTLSYEIDYKRVVSAVINDSRGKISAISGQNGMAIYAYIQAQIALVTPGVIVYRVLAPNGVLAGVVAINTNSGSVGVVFLQLRPSFGQFLAQISQIISNFIVNNTFLQDVLY